MVAGRSIALGLLFVASAGVLAADPPSAIVRLGETRFRGAADLVCVDYSSDGRKIAAADESGVVTVWDANSGRPTVHWQTAKAKVVRVRFAPDSSHLAVADSSAKIWVLNVSSGQVVCSVMPDRGVPGCFDWTTDGQEIVATSRFAKPVARKANFSSDPADDLLFLDARTGKLKSKADSETFLISHLFCLSDGKEILFTTADGSFGRYSVPQRKSRILIDKVPGATFSLAPDGKSVAAAGYDNARNSLIVQFDSETGNEIGRRMQLRKPVLSIAYSSDGKLIAANEERGHIRVWDRATGDERVALDAGGTTRHSLAFSPDGKTLVSAERLPWLRRWDLVNTREHEPAAGHRKPVVFVAFMNGGTWVISGGLDHSFLVWDVATGREVNRWDGQAITPYNVAPGPDDKSVLIAKD